MNERQAFALADSQRTHLAPTCAGVVRRPGGAEGVAAGQDGVPAGGRRHAPAVGDGVDAAEHPHGLRGIPDGVPQPALGARVQVRVDGWHAGCTTLSVAGSYHHRVGWAQGQYCVTDHQRLLHRPLAMFVTLSTQMKGRQHACRPSCRLLRVW